LLTEHIEENFIFVSYPLKLRYEILKKKKLKEKKDEITPTKFVI